MSTEDLQSKIRGGFQTSAFRGVTGEVESRAPDDSISKQGLRFAEMISNKLQPFPTRVSAPIPSAQFQVNTTNHKTRTFTDISHVTGAVAPEQFNRTGVVTGGLRDSRGFLETLSSTQRMHGAHDDEVMDAYNRGRAVEVALETERAALQMAPFSSNEPNPWKVSTMEHSNLSNVDESSYRNQYRSRHNLVANSGGQRDVTHQQIGCGNAVDRDALVEHLQKVREQTLPRGYKVPSGKAWQTTTQTFHSKYDISEAAVANGRGATVPAERNPVATAEVPERKTGDHVTEASSAFIWSGQQTTPDTKHRHRGALDIVNGVFTMSHKYHHPRSDVRSDAQYKPSEIVQGQYKPMSVVSVPAKN